MQQFLSLFIANRDTRSPLHFTVYTHTHIFDSEILIDLHRTLAVGKMTGLGKTVPSLPSPDTW